MFHRDVCFCCSRRWMKLVCPVHRPVTETELLELHPAGTLKYGSYIHTMQIDTRIYLAWLTDRFKSAGQSLATCPHVLSLYICFLNVFCPMFSLQCFLSNIFLRSSHVSCPSRRKAGDAPPDRPV